MKAILASLAGLPGDHAVLKVSAQIAKAHGAHVDALHVYMGPRTVQAAIGGYSSMTEDKLMEMSSVLVREENGRRNRAHAVFDEVCLRQGLASLAAPRPGGGASTSFVDVDSLAMAETARRARNYELTVMAREARLLPSRITMVLTESGRPLMLAPPNPRESVGSNIAIAWKPSPEAARALTAASPFLARATKVTLLVVPEGDDMQSDAIASARLLQETLAWRGLQVNVLATNASDDVGPALREAAYGLEADLLVMGAYGHSRFREFVLGGSTRSLLQNCDIPLLLAH